MTADRLSTTCSGDLSPFEDWTLLQVAASAQLIEMGAVPRAAAIAVTEPGHQGAFGDTGGFEADLDSEDHRGSKHGRRASGLRVEAEIMEGRRQKERAQ